MTDIEILTLQINSQSELIKQLKERIQVQEDAIKEIKEKLASLYESDGSESLYLAHTDIF